MIEILLLAAACLGGAALLWRRHAGPKRRLQALWRRLEAVLARHDLPEGTLSVAVAEDGTPSLHPIPEIPGHLRLALLSALADGLAALPWDERSGIRHLYLETGPEGAAFGNRMHVIIPGRPALLVGRGGVLEGPRGGGWKD